MRKYIREMLRELTGKKGSGYVPPVSRPRRLDLSAPQEPVLPGDLNNQELSKNPLQKTRQLDYQAQKNEERETS